MQFLMVRTIQIGMFLESGKATISWLAAQLRETPETVYGTNRVQNKVILNLLGIFLCLADCSLVCAKCAAFSEESSLNRTMSMLNLLSLKKRTTSSWKSTFGSKTILKKARTICSRNRRLGRRGR